MKSLCYKQTPYLGFNILQRFESVPNEILSTTVIYQDSRTALPLCMIWCFSRRYANPLNTCKGENPPPPKTFSLQTYNLGVHTHGTVLCMQLMHYWTTHS